MNNRGKQISNSGEIFAISEAIGRLDGKLTQGFLAIDQRLGVSNGRLHEHDVIIKQLCEKAEREVGFKQGISSFWKIVVTVLTIGIALMTYIALTK